MVHRQEKGRQDWEAMSENWKSGNKDWEAGIEGWKVRRGIAAMSQFEVKTDF